MPFIVKRNDEKLSEPLAPDIDNQYIKYIPDQIFEFQDESTVKEPFLSHDTYFKSRKLAYEQGLEENDWIYEDDDYFDEEDEDEENIEWEYWDNKNEGIFTFNAKSTKILKHWVSLRSTYLG